ncbi:MAG TPA: MarR family transcriptional regulator [Propionibacteriaceae bacterium]|nr:MarR family transcriptional regulator [Propionibacteriaceae bacterium]
MSTASIVGEGPSVATRLRLVWQWARRQIYAEVCAAGFDDLNRAHVSVFRYPGLGGRRPTEIADDMQITKQSVNELIGHLERQGYLRRVVDPDDSRARIIQLTPRGRALERTTFAAARNAELALANMLGRQRFARFRKDLDELVRLTSEDSTSAG